MGSAGVDVTAGVQMSGWLLTTIIAQ